MDVTVVCLGGEEHKLHVSLGATAQDVKDCLERELRVPSKMQTLSLSDCVLEDSAPLGGDTSEDLVLHLVFQARLFKKWHPTNDPKWQLPPDGMMDYAKSVQPRAWLRTGEDACAHIVARSATIDSWPGPCGHPDKDRHFGLWIHPQTNGEHYLSLDLGRNAKLSVVGAIFSTFGCDLASVMNHIEVRVSEESDPGFDGGTLIGVFSAQDLQAIDAEDVTFSHEATFLTRDTSARFVRFSFGTCRAELPVPAILGGPKRSDGNGTCGAVFQVFAWGVPIRLTQDLACEEGDRAEGTLSQLTEVTTPEEQNGQEEWFSLEELRSLDFCKEHGVCVTTRELHLTDEEFTSCFGMHKAEFARLPKWKQTSQKKEQGLF